MRADVMGIAGTIFIAIAWLLETIEILEQHKRFYDLKFAFLYLAGVIGLLIYAIMIRNFIFILVESIILSLIVFEIAYTSVRLCIYKEK